MAPRSRYTIGVHDDPALANQELSAAILTDGTPIVVERAMYRSGPRLFEAGAAAPRRLRRRRTSWYFAEGATGHLLRLNSCCSPTREQTRRHGHRELPAARWQRDHASSTRFRPARAGPSGWTTRTRQLADTAVSMQRRGQRRRSSPSARCGGPGSSETWTGGHASLGATTYVAPRWGVSRPAWPADHPTPSRGCSWPIPSTTPTTIRMTLLFDDGRPLGHRGLPGRRAEPVHDRRWAAGTRRRRIRRSVPSSSNSASRRASSSRAPCIRTAAAWCGQQAGPAWPHRFREGWRFAATGNRVAKRV